MYEQLQAIHIHKASKVLYCATLKFAKIQGSALPVVQWLKTKVKCQQWDGCSV